MACHKGTPAPPRRLKFPEPSLARLSSGLFLMRAPVPHPHPPPRPHPRIRWPPRLMPRSSTVLLLLTAIFAASSAAHKYSVSLTLRILTTVLHKPRIRDTVMYFTPRTAAATSMRVSNPSTRPRKGLWLLTKRFLTAFSPVRPVSPATAWCAGTPPRAMASWWVAIWRHASEKANTSLRSGISKLRLTNLCPDVSCLAVDIRHPRRNRG